jgi:hypothetical protein
LVSELRQEGIQASCFFKVLGDAIFLEHEDDLLPLSPTSLFI